MSSPLRVAMIGDRGIPARYSGFSTLVEEVSTRLVASHGMDVTVYCRSNYFDERPPQYRGVRLVYLSAPGGKSFESLVHSARAILHAACRPFDLAFVVDPGNGPLTLPLVARRMPFLVHTDGLGWQRTKWSALQRRYYRWSEWVSARLACWIGPDVPLRRNQRPLLRGRSNPLVSPVAQIQRLQESLPHGVSGSFAQTIGRI